MNKLYTLLASAIMCLTAQAQEVPGPYLDPQGETSICKVERDGMSVTFEGIVNDNSSAASRVIYGDDGDVYFKIVPKSGHSGYVRGVKQGDKIVVELPQHVGTIYDDFMEEDMDLYADVLNYIEEDGYGCYVNSGETSQLELSVAADGSFGFSLVGEDDGALPKTVVGIVSDLDPESMSWQGFCDWEARYSQSDEKPVTLPDGLKTDTWYLFYDYDARPVTVAINGNDFYLGNLTDELPDSYVKGTIDGDKVSLPLTFLGYSDKANNFVYFVPAYYEEKYVEEWGDYYTDYVVYPAFELDYDAEAKSLTNIEEYAAVFVGANPVVGEFAGSWINMYYEPTIKWIDPARADDPLKDPEFVAAYANEEYGCDYIDMFLPSFTQGDFPLDPSRLSYVFYLDGEPMTFTTDVYYGLTEDMTEIPFDFTDDMEDIISYGQEHEITLYRRGYKMVGVKMFYEKPDGTIVESALVEADIEELSEGEITGIADVNADVVRTEYYDLQGRRTLRANKGGVSIRVNHRADGSRSVQKVIVK